MTMMPYRTVTPTKVLTNLAGHALVVEDTIPLSDGTFAKKMVPHTLGLAAINALLGTYAEEKIDQKERVKRFGLASKFQAGLDAEAEVELTKADVNRLVMCSHKAYTIMFAGQIQLMVDPESMEDRE